MQLHPTVIFRVPQFSYQSKISDHWSELKESIREASPDFYEQIKNLDASQIETLDPSLRNTIWKYFNRARFRATPYGSFASVGVCRLSEGTAPVKVPVEQILHKFPDWTSAAPLGMNMPQLIAADAIIFSNSTYYSVGANTRYISIIEDKYELTDYPLETIEQDILKFCAVPVPINAVFKEFKTALSVGELTQIVKALLEDQLLLCDLQQNIIGEDFFSRTNQDYQIQKTPYVIAERPVIDPYLNKAVFKQLPELIEKLSHLIPFPKPTDLEKFIIAFTHKYESAEVPIMAALDPEIGIGYGQLEQTEGSDELIEKLNKNKKTAKNNGYQEHLQSAFLAHLLQKCGPLIQLEDLHLPELKEKGELPNTFSILCNVCDDLVFIENMGSCTANSILGRFTQANDQLLSHCREIKEIESQANPDVLFFDIGYCAGSRIDNVNRRKSIYDYQLSILNYDTSQSPLQVHDLLVSVSQGQLILRSKSSGKRLMPRLASAYNYQKSDLPLFRLLCDIQQQKLNFNLNLSLKSIIPGLAYYPRLQYKNIVLSPATWKLTAKANTGEHIINTSLEQLLAQNKIARYVRTGFSDQTLCFDLQDAGDLAQLQLMIKKLKSIEVTETLIPSSPSMIDITGNSLLPQYVLTAYHQQTIYQPFKSFNIDAYTDHAARIKNPGTEWLYFELYCHSSRSDEILLNYIRPVLADLSVQIEHWFFIRYNEKGDHIRLRLKLKDALSSGAVTSHLRSAISPLLNSGLIADMQLKTYNRELHRYGINSIDMAEAHFAVDSEYAMSIIALQPGNMALYQSAVDIFLAILEDGVLPGNEAEGFIKLNGAAFAGEHHFTAAEFKEMNSAFKQFSTYHSNVPQAMIAGYRELLIQSFLKTLNTYLPQQRYAVFDSLFHMHVNRLFSANQRTHEALIYYFLEKQMLRMKKNSA